MMTKPRWQLTLALATVLAAVAASCASKATKPQSVLPPPRSPAGSYLASSPLISTAELEPELSEEVSASKDKTTSTATGLSTLASPPATAPSTAGKTTHTSGAPAPARTSTTPTTPAPTTPTAPRPTRTGGSFVTVVITATEEQEAADRAAVEAAYLRYWDVFQKIPVMTKEERAIKFAEVATGPELDVLYHAASNVDRLHIGYEGGVTNRFRWRIPINGTNVAGFVNCQDQSKLITLVVSENRVVGPGPARGRSDITVRKGADGVWRVSAVIYPAVKC